MDYKKKKKPERAQKDRERREAEKSEAENLSRSAFPLKLTTS